MVCSYDQQRDYPKAEAGKAGENNNTTRVAIHV